MLQEPDEKSLDITVIIPVLNEIDTIEPLHQRLRESLENLDKTYELIFVDDGSTDGTFQKLRNIYEKDDKIKIFQFRRNFGKAEALSIGFKMAKGDIIITMDGDLQDDPQEIPRFLKKIEDGFDVVSGWKKTRLDPLSKRLPSKLFNKVLRIFFKIHIHDFNCGFKAYRKGVVKSINIYGELHRYIPVLASAKGFSVGELSVKHHPREFGSSKYGASRLLKGLFDLFTILLLTRFKKRPLHLFGYIGSGFTGIGIIILCYLSLLWLLGKGPIGTRPLMWLGILLLILGVELFSTGILGELLVGLSHDNYETNSIRTILSHGSERDKRQK